MARISAGNHRRKIKTARAALDYSFKTWQRCAARMCKTGRADGIVNSRFVRKTLKAQG